MNNGRLKAGRQEAIIKGDFLTNGTYRVHRDALYVVLQQDNFEGGVPAEPTTSFRASFNGLNLTIGCYHFGQRATRAIRNWAVFERR